ncbi:hypothetical protein CDV52_05965 [Haematobacter missouriensis]|uniref:Uncharacterized protein n=1 Tax=Haematobacter missouriensis TaxID=366616 RepID=A0A212AU41_9RHOB|nr:hypothetical protein CDV52_05965 [Haematobacter missouriensis]
MRCGAVRCGAVRCGAVRCGAVRCGAVRCGAVRCGAVRCGAVRCGAVRCGAVKRCMISTHGQSFARPMLGASGRRFWPPGIRSGHSHSGDSVRFRPGFLLWFMRAAVPGSGY